MSRVERCVQLKNNARANNEDLIVRRYMYLYLLSGPWLASIKMIHYIKSN